MKSIKTHISAALLATIVLTAPAQNTYSGYFIDSYTPRSEMNPAFAPDSERGYKGYVGFPALDNLNVGMRGNIHLTSIFYNRGGETVLFTHPDVTASEVLDNIKDNSRLGLGVKIDLLNCGFKAFGGWNTVGVNVVSDTEAGVPKSFFTLAKEGVANKDYDIRDMRAFSSNYAELALNHSRDLSKWVPGLRAGATLKLIMGIADVDARFNEANLILGENEWLVKADADIRGAGCGMRFKQKYNEKFNREYFDGIDFDGFKPGGFGLGLDLGTQYRWRDFSFSLALLDLGFINWSDACYATTGGLRTFNSDAYTLQVGNSGSWDQMKDDIEELYQLEVREDDGSYTRSLRTTLNWGVEYVLPYYRNLSFGLVHSTAFRGKMTWTDFHLSANVRPVKCLAASAGLAMGTYGVGFSWLVNVSTKGCNFFVGMDRTIGKLSHEGYPLNSNATVNLGLNFPF